jgi:hypothetical protein
MLAGRDNRGQDRRLYIGTEKRNRFLHNNMKTPTLLKCGAAAMFLALLNAGTCVAEDMTIAASTIMRGDRLIVSLKPGTVVEVVERGDKTITIKYKGQTGTIPNPAAHSGATVAQASTATKTAAAPTPSPAKKSLVVDAPQSTYGNLVKKAETNAAKHEANLVNPADAVMDDQAK